MSGAALSVLDAGALITLAVLAALLLLDRRRAQARRSEVAPGRYTTDPLHTFEHEDAAYIGPGQPAVALTLLDPPADGELSDGADVDLALFTAARRTPPRPGDAAALATAHLLAADAAGPLPLSARLRWIVVAAVALAALAPLILPLLAS